MAEGDRPIKPLDQAIADLVEAARAEARAAALGLPHLVRVPDARGELVLSIATSHDAGVRRAEERARELRLRPLLEVLDQVLAGAAAHALCLESPTDRAELRRLVAAAAIDHHPPRRSS